MGNRVWRKIVFAVLCPTLLLFATHAGAVSVQKIEVASHLGEPFFAEVPLKLESNELASKVFVEIAGPSDYKIFEVYRDPVLKSIRADLASDKRGVRVKLSSRSRIKSPFFNLVLKIRYGRVSHFKKFPVFLDVAKSIRQVATKAPLPAVKAINQSASVSEKPAKTSLTTSAGQVFMPGPSTAVISPVKPEVKYYEGWARTDRYGPIIRGDTLSTVAERLRIDYRYTRNQIMQALFEKNKASFDQNNINLLKADSYLKVPTASEIEQHNKVEAMHFLAEQEKNWKKLTQQPRYAAVAEAQRTRYTKRISMGEHADGVASAPLAVAKAADKPDIAAQIKQQLQPQAKSEVSRALPSAPADSTAIAQSETTKQAALVKQIEADQIEQVIQAQNESSRILEKLQQQNTLLQKQLSGNQNNFEALNRKVENDAASAAAAEAHMEKLEILISRLQSELEKVDQQKPTSLAADMDWMIWLLIALVVILLVVVAMMMRREPAHPAVDIEPSVADKSVETTSEGQSETLESVIKHEVAGIETSELEIPMSRETATIDSLPVFADVLSETDTAELEPFDADVHTEPDPDIDYIAEADVYIRYGMDDEAIKQLDMTLRLQPDNVAAHIKKAELLLGKSNQPGLDESVAAATMALTAVDLDKFKASIEKLGAEAGQYAAESENQKQTKPDERTEDTLPLDESTADDIDFDLSDLDVPDIEDDKQSSEQDQTDDTDAIEAMSWLHDAAFDDDIISDKESDPDQRSDAIDTEAMTTRELDNLLTEFSDHESGQATAEAPVMTDVLGTTSTATLPDFGVTSGATQELDQLLSEFDEDKDDGINFMDTQSGPGDEIFKQSTDESEIATSKSVGIDADHGATQELDNLLSAFSNEEEQTLDFDQAKIGAVSEESEHDATQVLGHLLDEFNDGFKDEDDEGNKKS